MGQQALSYIVIENLKWYSLYGVSFGQELSIHWQELHTHLPVVLTNLYLREPTSQVTPKLDWTEHTKKHMHKVFEVTLPIIVKDCRNLNVFQTRTGLVSLWTYDLFILAYTYVSICTLYLCLYQISLFLSLCTENKPSNNNNQIAVNTSITQTVWKKKCTRLPGYLFISESHQVIKTS